MRICFTLLFFLGCNESNGGRTNSSTTSTTGTGGMHDIQPTGGDGCGDAAKLVYVVDESNTFSSFDPTTKQFADKGTLSCPASGGATPFSMGIDRNAGAWVLYSNGQLFSVDTSTLACTPTSWSPGTGGLMVFGMGFSTDVAGGTTDTLFISGGSDPLSAPSSSLNTLNLASMAPSPVGTVTDWPELTGTGDAELWGFFPSTNQPRIEKIDKTSGAALTTYPLNSLNGTPSAWAFAFFGGDFYVFLMKDIEFSTTVYQVNGQTGAITSTTPTNTRTIVGAGVSTCAPTVIL